MQLPTFQEIELLHKKYAPSQEVFDSVFSHCQIVRDIAEQLIDSNNLAVDRELVIAGCLLHDIGVYPLFNADGSKIDSEAYITHSIRGEKILQDEGFPEVIWRFAAHHTGVGLSKEDITSQNLPLPHQDFLAETAEERLIMYADKFHSKSTPPQFNDYQTYREFVSQHGEHKAIQFDELAKEFGVPYLVPLVAKYKQAL